MNKELEFLMIGSNEGYWYEVLQDALQPLGTVKAVTQENAAAAVETQSYALIIVDATNVDQVPELVTRLRRVRSGTRIIVVTASPTWTRARTILRAGALDYVAKSLNTDDIINTVQEALEKVVPPLPAHW